MLFRSVALIDREIDDPGKGKAILIGQAQFIANHRVGAACDGFKRLGLAAEEEGRVADLQAKLLADSFCALGADVLGQWSRGLPVLVGIKDRKSVVSGRGGGREGGAPGGPGAGLVNGRVASNDDLVCLSSTAVQGSTVMPRPLPTM